MTPIIRSRRRSQRKRHQLNVRPSPFPGWRTLSLEALSARIDEIRRTAFTRVLSPPEWAELDRMRAKLRAEQKFAQAVREVQS
jgi:hypothetical protein